MCRVSSSLCSAWPCHLRAPCSLSICETSIKQKNYHLFAISFLDAAAQSRQRQGDWDLETPMCLKFWICLFHTCSFSLISPVIILSKNGTQSSEPPALNLRRITFEGRKQSTLLPPLPEEVHYKNTLRHDLRCTHSILLQYERKWVVDQALSAFRV